MVGCLTPQAKQRANTTICERSEHSENRPSASASVRTQGARWPPFTSGGGVEDGEHVPNKNYRRDLANQDKNILGGRVFASFTTLSLDTQVVRRICNRARATRRYEGH